MNNLITINLVIKWTNILKYIDIKTDTGEIIWVAPMYTTEFAFLIKKRKYQDQMASPLNSTKHIRKKLYQSNTNFCWKEKRREYLLNLFFQG